MEFAHFVYHRAYGEEPVHFIKKVLTGEGILGWVTDDNGEFVGRVNRSETGESTVEGEIITSPAKMRWDKIRDKTVDKDNRKKWLAYLIQAMNWYCSGEPRKRLRYRSTDRFPQPNVERMPELKRSDFIL